MIISNPTRAEQRVRRIVHHGLRIAVVVPCYNVEAHINEVVETIPDYVSHVVLVNDGSSDRTGELIKLATGGRVFGIHLARNRGVGEAVLTGFARAAEMGADVLVKMDGDGQMDPRYLPLLVEPLLLGKADYTKGNRFRNVLLPDGMPTVRRVGNAVLSFLNKSASGYWNVFDPTNGYIAMRREIIDIVPANWIHRRFFFESSMLIALGIMGAVVLDVALPARYGLERSNLRIGQTLFEFPIRMTVGLIRRIWVRKILYSLTMEALLAIFGVLFFLAGLAYGFYEFTQFTLIRHTPSPPGTVMAAGLLMLFGFQMVLNAILLDIQSVPDSPLCERWENQVSDHVTQRVEALGKESA
jgi:glycosyltransferase involved in cell wall biosynthesis